MSKTEQNTAEVVQWKHDRRERAKGNKWAQIPYDEKLIRDELKQNIYKSIRILNMKPDEWKAYLKTNDYTYLEFLFLKAIESMQWSVIERFFDRVIGTPAIKQVNTDNEQPQQLNLRNLSEDELRTLRELHRKVSGT